MTTVNETFSEVGQIKTDLAENSIIGQIIREKFGPKSESNQYLISVQGSSASGKSTISNNIYNIMVKNNIEAYLLKLDNYYKTDNEPDIRNYNFDNPGALDWDKINAVLQAFDNDNELIPTYKYHFQKRNCMGPFYIRNNKPRVIIIEGIYAFNPINAFHFNSEEFDPLDTNKKIENEFILNESKFKFKILKIKLSMCKSKSLEVRLERDHKQREKPKDLCLFQFNNHVWPATERWINNHIFKEDIRIVHGSFNEKDVIILLEELIKYFVGKDLKIDAIKYESDLKHCFEIDCSGECGYKE